jgi:DedD protein
MGLLSIFRRQVDPSSQGAAISEPADAVQRARTRARQRLIGAVVLVGIGVIGFPLVFETQPRPIPVDIPIEIPRKEGAPALVMPQARGPTVTAGSDRASTPAAAAPAAVLEPGAGARDEVITEAREEAGRDPAVASQPAVGGAQRAGSVPPTKAPTPASPSVVGQTGQKPVEPTLPALHADGARAKALLEGKEPPAAAAPRFVVQVGAFADAAAAREVRLKVEKLGLKTYTQVTETASGSRIRVRVGPFATRGEADKAQARARSAGLAATVLTL